jgi:hypothetical protein
MTGDSNRVGDSGGAVAVGRTQDSRAACCGLVIACHAPWSSHYDIIYIIYIYIIPAREKQSVGLDDSATEVVPKGHAAGFTPSTQ